MNENKKCFESNASPIDGETRQSMINYRKLIYARIYQEVKKEGLLKFLEIPRTVEKIQKSMSFDTSRTELLESLLKLLVDIGVLQSFFDGAARRVYYSNNGRLEDYLTNPPVSDVTQMSTGQMSQTHSGLPDVVIKCLRGEDADIQFDEVNKEFWRTVLEAPFYASGRDLAADEIGFEGARALDLASGQGHGLKRLAKNVGATGQVIGVELSDYHVRVARKETGDLQNVTIHEGNLEEGLHFLEDAGYHGAMIIGAFHFLQKKEKFIERVSQLLKPKSKFVIGNVFLDVDVFDRPYIDMMFSATKPKATPIKPERLKFLLEDQGFRLFRAYHVGCWGWYFGERDI